MAVDVDTVQKLFDILERLDALTNRGTISKDLATDAKRKINEVLEEIFPPPPE